MAGELSAEMSGEQGSLAFSQALLYARDLKKLYGALEARERDLAAAYRRLNQAYHQSLRYAQDLKRVHSELERAIFQSLRGLARALEARDPNTHGHSERVAELSGRLARSLGTDPSHIRVIARAGLLHDIGKIGIPDAILRKPGSLSDEEWAIMRDHPAVGARIIAAIHSFSEEATVIRHHHERLDGSGYPEGLSGDEIPRGARIVAVADVYDALTSPRPYRRALSSQEALLQIEALSGRVLDGDLVACFLSLFSDGRPDPSICS
jgi:putative nucleotidyltransferase with HDIG domain